MNRGVGGMQGPKGHRVALGLGNNVDYEIQWDTPVVERLVDKHGITGGDIHPYTEVRDERELVCSILYYLSNGSGHEVYVGDSEIVEAFSQLFTRRVTMGGTCIRAAIAMSRLGASAAMHLVTMNDAVRAQLPKGCDYVCSNDRDSSYPHLIIQYKAGTRIRANGLDIQAPLPNRIIYTNDMDNMRMRLNESYGALIRHARIFLISGFNVIVDQATLDDRIDALLSIMKALPLDALVFSESGCYFKEAFQKHVIARLRDKVHIFSMNEEEMQQILDRRVDLMDAADVERALSELRARLDVRCVLVHTHLWAAVAGENATRFDEAVASAVAMASTRFRFGDVYGEAEFRSTMDLPKQAGTEAFTRALVRRMGTGVCCKPVPAVPETNVTTVGLGDSFVGGFMLPFA